MIGKHKTIKSITGTKEKEREELLENMSNYISDDLKKTIDMSYKLAKKEVPSAQLTFTNRSGVYGNSV